MGYKYELQGDRINICITNSMGDVVAEGPMYINTPKLSIKHISKTCTSLHPCVLNTSVESGVALRKTKKMALINGVKMEYDKCSDKLNVDRTTHRCIGVGKRLYPLPFKLQYFYVLKTRKRVNTKVIYGVKNNKRDNLK